MREAGRDDGILAGRNQVYLASAFDFEGTVDCRRHLMREVCMRRISAGDALKACPSVPNGK